MPWSWIRVSTRTSPKLRACIGDDTSAGHVAACVSDIAAAAGATETTVAFEADGRHARVHFYWDDPSVKFRVVYDLEGTEVIDLLGHDELEEIARRGASAT